MRIFGIYKSSIHKLILAAMSSFHFRSWFSGGRNFRVKGSVTCNGTVFSVRRVLATLLVGGSQHSYAAPLLNDLILSRLNLFEFSFSSLT